MKNRTFPFPMRTYERVIALLYIPIHSVFLPELMYLFIDLLNLDVSRAQFLFVRYLISALVMLLALNRYWRATIGDLGRSKSKTLDTLVLSCALYWALNYVVSFIMPLLLQSVSNPNSAAVNDSLSADPSMTMIVTVLLAPIAEETMFRGALFGTIRKKSRIAAYIVSVLLFAFYHLWAFALVGDWRVFIYMLQYFPAGIALAWCYEHAGTLVTPVVLHALINLIASVSFVWR